MILRLGLTEVDLGRASTMTLLSAQLVQLEDRTATGKPYTITWSYYTGKGWRFGFDWMEETTLDDLSLFHLTIAEAKKNIIETELDDGSIHINTRFLSNPIEIGEQDMRVGYGVIYQDIGFSIEVLP